MRILVSGGGTAGHISPILATLDALKSLDKEIEVLYVGSSGGMEAKIVTAAGLRFAAVSAGKLRRFHGRSLHHNLLDFSSFWLNIRDMFRVVRGIFQSLKLIRNFKPNIIFIKGGYVGLPVGLAARILRVPYVIHESDVLPGLTNRILSKRAAKIAVGFPVDKYPDLDQARLVYTGNPIRNQISKSHRLEGMTKFKLADNLPVVLIIGGSQGAAAINDVVVDALPELVKKYQVIHVTGEREIERIKFEVRRLHLEYPEHYQAYSFLMDEMGMALAAADLVISRAGANSIAELAMLGKPTILIPNHRLTGGHQLANAQLLARRGAVRVIGEQKLNTRSLQSEIERVLSSAEEQQLLSKSIKEFAVPAAAQKLAQTILEEAEIDPEFVEPGSEEGGSE